ncbi:MAG: ABC transporter permease, partial [Longimicrobiales bacterium]|nr:ABC transporter permease [Longimicrobiales bacterium]
AFLLSEMVPVFLVLMVALGCFVPAIDSTAGERERGTWETLMTVAASRTSVVTSKYLYVATLGTVAGVLNIGAMAASVGAVLGSVVGGEAGTVSSEYFLRAIPVMLLGAVILALFFAAAMMILAAFARTFRDGQSMVTPVYWLAVVPLFMAQAPDQHLSPELALVPIINVTLMIRDAIQGILSWPLILESFAVGVIMVAACIWIARWILDFEDVLMGSYDGSFWRFLRERVRS